MIGMLPTIGFMAGGGLGDDGMSGMGISMMAGMAGQLLGNVGSFGGYNTNINPSTLQYIQNAANQANQQAAVNFTNLNNYLGANGSQPYGAAYGSAPAQSYGPYSQAYGSTNYPNNYGQPYGQSYAQTGGWGQPPPYPPPSASGSWCASQSQYGGFSPPMQAPPSGYGYSQQAPNSNSWYMQQQAQGQGGFGGFSSGYNQWPSGSPPWQNQFSNGGWASTPPIGNPNPAGAPPTNPVSGPIPAPTNTYGGPSYGNPGNMFWQPPTIPYFPPATNPGVAQQQLGALQSSSSNLNTSQFLNQALAVNQNLVNPVGSVSGPGGGYGGVSSVGNTQGVSDGTTNVPLAVAAHAYYNSDTQTTVPVDSISFQQDNSENNPLTLYNQGQFTTFEAVQPEAQPGQSYQVTVNWQDGATGTWDYRIDPGGTQVSIYNPYTTPYG